MLLLLTMSSCKKSDKFDEYQKIADNLYEVTCDEYDYDYLLKEGYGNVDYLEEFGCSGVRQGNYLGRNFDFVAWDAAEIVVKTTHKDNRYSSIGVTGGLFWLTSEFMDNGLDEDAKKLIPIFLLDGINEKGLVIEINCVNANDVGGIIQHTNPGKKQIHELCVVKYLLDNAASAKEAIEMIKDIDIVNTRDAMGLQNYTYDVHFLICDEKDSYVVEINNSRKDLEKIVVLEGEEVMTNFYLHLSDIDNNVFPDNSAGIERYRKLKDNKNSVNSFEDMKELMRSVKYTNSYRLDNEYDPGIDFDNKYTCFSDHTIYKEDEVIHYANHQEHYDELMSKMALDEIEVEKVLNDPKLENPDKLWVTSHSSVYDIENKLMSIAVYERFDKYYNYSLEEQ